MLIVNIGKQGMTKRLDNGLGGVFETKTFPPNIPVECSKQMAEMLLKKYNDSTMAIYFLPLDETLHQSPVCNSEPTGITSEELEKQAVNDFKEIQGYPESIINSQQIDQRRRGRPKGAKNK